MQPVHIAWPRHREPVGLRFYVIGTLLKPGGNHPTVTITHDSVGVLDPDPGGAKHYQLKTVNDFGPPFNWTATAANHPHPNKKESGWAFFIIVDGVKVPAGILEIEVKAGGKTDTCEVSYDPAFAFAPKKYGYPGGPSVTISEPPNNATRYAPNITTYGFVSSSFSIQSKSAHIYPAGGGSGSAGTEMVPPLPPFQWSFQFGGVTAGNYIITVEMTDSQGNSGSASTGVTVQ